MAAGQPDRDDAGGDQGDVDPSVAQVGTKVAAVRGVQREAQLAGDGCVGEGRCEGGGVGRGDADANRGLRGFG